MRIDYEIMMCQVYVQVLFVSLFDDTNQLTLRLGQYIIR